MSGRLAFLYVTNGGSQKGYICSSAGRRFGGFGHKAGFWYSEWNYGCPQAGPGLKRNTPPMGVSAGKSAGLVDDQGQPDQERPEDEVQDPGAEGQGSQHGQPEHNPLHHDLPGCFTGMKGHFLLPFEDARLDIPSILSELAIQTSVVCHPRR